MSREAGPKLLCSPLFSRGVCGFCERREPVGVFTTPKRRHFALRFENMLRKSVDKGCAFGRAGSGCPQHLQALPAGGNPFPLRRQPQNQPAGMMHRKRQDRCIWRVPLNSGKLAP